MANKYIFKRVEKKYFITEETARALFDRIGHLLDTDPHGKSTVYNIYLDTPSFLLIRNSIDAKTYKEKLRMRSYGVPKPDSHVFLELKKKYHGVVYKRRLSMTYSEALDYIIDGKRTKDSQIMREIDYSMKYYGNPGPGAVIIYDREAFYFKENSEVRLTFDRNVRYRFDDLTTASGDSGTVITEPGAVLMEIKTDGAMPLSLVKALSELKIYPSSFSKYGTAYTHMLTKKKSELTTGEKQYV
ncbi:MAG: polyphosphate polymerase domain-containing protein [Ruminococcaceae bacterium]|nr:polyphosphate polymerase domain-containing protein [Oscillospiraceae bacterium]